MNRTSPHDAPEWLKAAFENAERRGFELARKPEENAERTCGFIAAVDFLFDEFAAAAAEENQKRIRNLREVTGAA